MGRGASWRSVALAVMMLAAGSALVWLALFLTPLADARAAVAAGDDAQALALYGTAEQRLKQLPAVDRMFPSLVPETQANQVRLLYRLGRYDEAVAKASASADAHGAHFWAGTSLFARGAAEEAPQARLAWFDRAESEFRAALGLRPDDFDTRYNYELTHSLLARLRVEPKTPRKLLFELLRPQSPRTGGNAPPRRTG